MLGAELVGEPGPGLARAAQVGLALVVVREVPPDPDLQAAVAVIPQWISKMQECRGRECPSIEPDSRRAAYGRWLRL